MYLLLISLIIIVLYNLYHGKVHKITILLLLFIILNGNHNLNKNQQILYSTINKIPKKYQLTFKNYTSVVFKTKKQFMKLTYFNDYQIHQISFKFMAYKLFLWANVKTLEDRRGLYSLNSARYTHTVHLNKQTYYRYCTSQLLTWYFDISIHGSFMKPLHYLLVFTDHGKSKNTILKLYQCIMPYIPAPVKSTLYVFTIKAT